MQMQSNDHAPVVTCNVTECSYNETESCCAPQIDVGGNHAMCDTFTMDAGIRPMSQDMSAVGKCDVTQCTFNEDRGCDAPGITVNHHAEHADCGSYRPMH